MHSPSEMKMFLAHRPLLETAGIWFCLAQVVCIVSSHGLVGSLLDWQAKKILISYLSTVTSKPGDLGLVLYLSSFSFLTWKMG